MVNSVYEFLKWGKDWLTLLAPVGAGIGLVWKYFLKRKYEEFKSAHENLKRIASALPTIERIDAEFKPNGGSSLKDAINRIERKLHQNERHFTALIKSMPYGIFIADESGSWKEVNLVLCRMTTRTESELTGLNWLSWVDETEKQDIINSYKNAISNAMVVDLEFTYVTGDDQLKSFRITANPQKNEKNELVGYLGTVYELI